MTEAPRLIRSHAPDNSDGQAANVDNIFMVQSGNRQSGIRRRMNNFGNRIRARRRLERFVRGELLRRIHDRVFAILALESEPVDPRL